MLRSSMLSATQAFLIIGIGFTFINIIFNAINIILTPVSAIVGIDGLVLWNTIAGQIVDVEITLLLLSIKGILLQSSNSCLIKRNQVYTSFQNSKSKNIDTALCYLLVLLIWGAEYNMKLRDYPGIR